MAFQAGSIKISGTIDGLSFYHSMFGWLVRRKGGPGRRQFKTSPAFARSRENSAEFTACSRAAAGVRRAVVMATGIKDKTLYHRLMKLMRLLANDDTRSTRGQRDPIKGMQTGQGLHRLRHFELGGEFCLCDILLKAGFLAAPVEDTGTKCVRAAAGASQTLKRRQRKRKVALRITASAYMRNEQQRPMMPAMAIRTIMTVFMVSVFNDW